MWFVQGASSSDVVDESAVELVHNLLSVPCPVLTHAPTGWSTAVANAFYDTCSNANYTSLPNLYPFIVGGVGCSTTDDYSRLRAVAAVGNSWNALVAHPTETTLLEVHAALDALKSIQVPMLPDSVLSRVAAYVPTIQDAVDCMHAILNIDEAALTVPNGLLACSYDCIDTDALVQMLIGRNIVACHAALKADFTMEMLSDAKSWTDMYTSSDTVSLHSASEVKLLYKSAGRTHQEVVPSSIASDAVQLWITPV